MTAALHVAVAGIGAWTPGYAGWSALRTALRDPTVGADRESPRRPSPALLPPAERRRVPDGVAVALEVAREAIATAGPIDTASLASVFASAHGDLAIVDYLCATLASDPTLLSPTRFHHSVHNAASGYWSIATPSMGPSTALAAGDHSVAIGLLDAVTMVVAEARPVLLVIFDTPAVGLLANVAPNTALFGAALLLLPAGRVAPGTPTLALEIHQRPSLAPTTRDARFAVASGSSPAARGLALLERLAHADDTTIDYPMDGTSTLAIHVMPASPHPAATG